MDIREKMMELLIQNEIEFMAYSTNRVIDAAIGDDPVDRFLSRAAFTADFLLSNGVTMQEWISVKDRLPNYFEHVLINTTGDKQFATVHEAHLRKDGLWVSGLYRYDVEDVTNWMPLPQPHKGE